MPLRDFGLYLNRLPEDYLLDGLLHLTNVYFTMQKWELTEIYADELINLARTVYEHYERTYRQSKTFHYRAERHLVSYYGQGYLIKGVSLQFQKRYEEIQKYIDCYADLSWFVGLDELGKKEVEKFKLFAKLNTYNLKVLLGDQSIIPEYIESVKKHPYEILPALRVIVEASNIHGFFIDDVFEQFNIDIELSEQLGNYYNNVVTRNRYLRLSYHLSLYYFRKRILKRDWRKQYLALNMLLI